MTYAQDRELAALASDARAIREATRHRDRLVVSARAQGCTWKQIAEATGLTMMGVRKIFERNTHTEES